MNPALSSPVPTASGPNASVRRILIVDDEEGVRSLLARWLESSGYPVATATTADAALDAFATGVPPAIMLCDIRMPGHDGMWLVARVRQEFPETAVIMSSGVQDEHAAEECLRHGAVEYLTKPFGRDRLQRAVQKGIEWHEAAAETQRWRRQLEGEMADRTEGILRTLRGLTVECDQDVDALLAIALNERDAYAHAHRVRYLAVATAKKMARPDGEIAVLSRAALLHDIGKAALPVALLRKPAALTVEEAAIMRTYPSIGAELVGQVPFLESAAAVVRDAHERMDGSGYPRGVRASAVSVAARILGIADAYDTMTHARVFRDPITQSQAMLEIARCSGTQFDPDVVAAFKTVVPR